MSLTVDQRNEVIKKFIHDYKPKYTGSISSQNERVYYFDFARGETQVQLPVVQGIVDSLKKQNILTELDIVDNKHVIVTVYQNAKVK